VESSPIEKSHRLGGGVGDLGFGFTLNPNFTTLNPNFTTLNPNITTLNPYLRPPLHVLTPTSNPPLYALTPCNPPCLRDPVYDLCWLQSKTGTGGGGGAICGLRFAV